MANKQIVVKLGAETSGVTTAMETVKKSTKGATDGLKQGFNETGSTSKKTGGIIKNAFSGLGGVIAGAFAVSSIAGFGKSVIEAAANAAVVESQFGQSFKGIEGVGADMLENLSSKFNILPERLKGPMSAFQSYFKGSGASAMESAEMTEQAMNIAADGAAYYDKSLEETQDSLKSFLMGNYEAGDALGINTNATKVAKAYNDKYGGSFDDLSDAQKQNYLLEYVDDIYALNGAMGQGEREASGYENVMGNLKQSWTNFLAGLGEAALPIAIGLMEKLGNWINNIDTEALVNGFMSVGSYIRDLFTPIIDVVIETVQKLWDKFVEAGGIEAAKAALEGVSEALAWLKDNGLLVASAVMAIVTAIMIFKTLTAIAAIVSNFSKVMQLFKAGQIAAAAAQMGLNTALLANPFTWVAVAVVALIAAVIALWQNWDTVSAFLKSSWESIKETAGAVFNWLGAFLSTIWEGIKSGVIGAWNATASFLVGLWNGIKQFGIDIFTKLKNDLNTTWEAMKQIVTNTWNGIKNFFTSVVSAIVTFAVNRFNDFKKGVSTIFNAIKSFFAAFWNGVDKIFTSLITSIITMAVTWFTNFKNLITNIFNNIKTIITTVWNAIKSTVSTVVSAMVSVVVSLFNTLKNSISTVFNAIKNTASTIWNNIKTAISNVVTGIKTTVSNIFNTLKSGVTTTWNSIKSAITTPIEAAKNAVKRAIDKIKGFMNFKWELPKLKMPKFSISGKFSLNPPSIPKMGVSWHKSGGIVKGTNGGTIVGMGEDGGDEAILPLSNKSRMKPFAQAVAKMMPSQDVGGHGGDTVITGNTFHVREEADIKKVAQELYKLEQRHKRSKGRGN